MQFWNAFTGLLGAAAATSTGAPTTGVDATGLSVPGSFPTAVAPTVTAEWKDEYRPAVTASAETGALASVPTETVTLKPGATVPTVTTHVPDSFSPVVTHMPEQTGLAGQHNDIFDQYLHPQNAHAEIPKVDWSKVDLDELFKDSVPVTSTALATDTHGVHASASDIATHHAEVNPLDRMFEPLGVPPLNVNKAASTTGTHEAHVTASEAATHTGKPDPLDEMFKEFGIGEETTSSTHHPDLPVTSELAKAPTSAASSHGGHSANITTMEELHAHASQLGMTPADLKEAAAPHGTNTTAAGPMDELMQNLKTGNGTTGSNTTHEAHTVSNIIDHNGTSLNLENPEHLWQYLSNATSVEARTAPHAEITGPHATDNSIALRDSGDIVPYSGPTSKPSDKPANTVTAAGSEVLSDEHRALHTTIGSNINHTGLNNVFDPDHYQQNARGTMTQLPGNYVDGALKPTELVKDSPGTASKIWESAKQGVGSVAEKVSTTYNSLPSAKEVVNSAQSTVYETSKQLANTVTDQASALYNSERVQNISDYAKQGTHSVIKTGNQLMGAAGDYVSNAETRKALADGVTDRVTSFTNAAGEYIPSGEKLQSLRDTATGSMRSVANLTGEYIPNAAKQGTETFWKSTEGVRGTFTQFAQGAGERISGFHVAVGSVGTILAGAAYGGAKRFGKKKAEEAPAATDKPDANAEAKPGNTNLTGDNVSAEKEQPIGSGEDAKKPSSTPEKEQTVAPHQEPEKHLDVDHQSAPIESRKHTSSSASHEIPDAPKVAAAKTSNTTASAHEEVKPRATSATSKSKSSGTWRKFADGVDSLLKKFGKLLGRIR